jgi:hypothetical protein
LSVLTMWRSKERKRKRHQPVRLIVSSVSR